MNFKTYDPDKYYWACIVQIASGNGVKIHRHQLPFEVKVVVGETWGQPCISRLIPKDEKDVITHYTSEYNIFDTYLECVKYYNSRIRDAIYHGKKVLESIQIVIDKYAGYPIKSSVLTKDSFTPGDRIMHEVYGLATIISVPHSYYDSVWVVYDNSYYDIIDAGKSYTVDINLIDRVPVTTDNMPEDGLCFTPGSMTKTETIGSVVGYTRDDLLNQRYQGLYIPLAKDYINVNGFYLIFQY